MDGTSPIQQAKINILETLGKIYGWERVDILNLLANKDVNEVLQDLYEVGYDNGLEACDCGW